MGRAGRGSVPSRAVNNKGVAERQERCIGDGSG